MYLYLCRKSLFRLEKKNVNPLRIASELPFPNVGLSAVSACCEVHNFIMEIKIANYIQAGTINVFANEYILIFTKLLR